jgi:hypothetical protein
MLNKPIEKIHFGDDGKVVGVEAYDEEGSEKVLKVSIRLLFEFSPRALRLPVFSQIAKCKQLIADPSYFLGTDKIKQTGQV